MFPALFAALLQGGHPSMVADSVKPRPKYDPRVEQQHGQLLDSLTALMGDAPDSVNVRRLPSLKQGETFGNVISLNEPDKDVLVHELGHFWSAKQNPASLELADSIRVDPMSRRGSERVADTYATLLRARNDTTQISSKDAKLLYRILGRHKLSGGTP